VGGLLAMVWTAGFWFSLFFVPVYVLVQHAVLLAPLRERAAVANDELTNRAAEEMNRRMYILSLVAAVFLPLGLITGLLGINVGGVPGTNYAWGFWVVSGLLVAIGLLTTAFLKRLF
jgi:zinc transporter